MQPQSEDRDLDAMVRRAAGVIRAGGVIFYPTDTVYGLGCDPFNGKAIERVFEIKRRPETKPALLLVLDRAMLDRVVMTIPPVAARLMDRFWPGPLTIILPARRDLHPLLTGGTSRVGVRVPDHQFCLRLMEESGGPVVSTSANISGTEMNDDIGVLRSQFGKLVDLFIDAGAPLSNTPSTVVEVAEGVVKVMRDGVISRDSIRELVGHTS